MILSSLDSKIEYVKGVDNSQANALSHLLIDDHIQVKDPTDILMLIT
uniref:Putative LOC101166628 [Oryzias latipes] n=1 Tax=Lepeophtheirus salmonis TaxID=72036 RepID=A0A0K2U4F4_LEPSM